MTFEFAQKEAQRRTSVLGTTHYVVFAEGTGIDPQFAFMVMSYRPDAVRYTVVETFEATA